MSQPRLPSGISALLSADNYKSWSEEVMAYTMSKAHGDYLLWQVIDPAESLPVAAKEKKKWDQANLMAYGIIFGLIHADHRGPLTDLDACSKTGRAAWAALRIKHQSSSRSHRISLRKLFYSLSHDLALGVEPFISAIKATVKDMDAIGIKPADDEIEDKLFSGLHLRFSPIRTSLTTRQSSLTFGQIVSEVLEWEKIEGLAPSQSSISTPFSTSASDEVMYARSRKSSSLEYTDFSWGNPDNRLNVCFRCGKSGHPASRCTHDMPEDVKRHILGRSEVHVHEEAHLMDLGSRNESGLTTHSVESVLHELHLSSSPHSNRRSRSIRGGRRSRSASRERALEAHSVTLLPAWTTRLNADGHNDDWGYEYEPDT